MKSYTVLMLASAAVTQAIQQCSGTAKEEGGNWFCGAVDQILYSNVGHPGTYKAVNHMGDDGSCTFEDVAFSGPLAPFNEEVSFVFSQHHSLTRSHKYSQNPSLCPSSVVPCS